MPRRKSACPQRNQQDTGLELFPGEILVGGQMRPKSKMVASTFGDNWKRGPQLDTDTGKWLQASPDLCDEPISPQDMEQTPIGNRQDLTPLENTFGRMTQPFQTLDLNTESCRSEETYPLTGMKCAEMLKMDYLKRFPVTYSFVAITNYEESQQTMLNRLVWIGQYMYIGELAIAARVIVHGNKLVRTLTVKILEPNGGAATEVNETYIGQEHIVIDEFRGGIDIAHMLRWLDRYPVLVETKGGSVPLACRHIWITSNLDPRNWYPDIDQATLDALLRRLEITHFSLEWQ